MQPDTMLLVHDVEVCTPVETWAASAADVGFGVPQSVVRFSLGQLPVPSSIMRLVVTATAPSCAPPAPLTDVERVALVADLLRPGWEATAAASPTFPAARLDVADEASAPRDAIAIAASFRRSSLRALYGDVVFLVSIAMIIERGMSASSLQVNAALSAWAGALLEAAGIGAVRDA